VDVSEREEKEEAQQWHMLLCRLLHSRRNTSERRLPSYVTEGGFATDGTRLDGNRSETSGKWMLFKEV